MKKIFLAAVFLVQTQLLIASGFYIERNSAVKIIWETEKVSIPEKFVNKHEIVKKTILDNQIKSSMGIVLKFLQKYPDDLLKKNLSTINLFSEIKIQNMTIKGLFNSKDLFIVYDTKQSSFDYRTLESALHYYYLHLLLENNKTHLDEKSWDSLNPKGFEYHKDHEALHFLTYIPASDDKKPYSEQFLYASSSHSLEEDFAGIAKNLFLSDKHFWNIVKQNPKIEKKVELVIEFLNQLNKQLTKKYFIEISAN